jgi:flagellin
MADISLSKAVRSNLLSLKSTADMMTTTQNRLATGNKVNSALDNPSNWFTAKGLTNRSSDLAALIDSMANGIQTLEAADNGLTAMTKTLESMQSTLRQARQDKTFQTASYSVNVPTTATTDAFMTLSGGAVGEDEIAVGISTATSKLEAGTFDADGLDFTNAGANDGEISFTIAVDGDDTGVAITISYDDLEGIAADRSAVTSKELAKAINAKLTEEEVTAKASVDGDGNLVFTSTTAQATGAASQLAIFAFDAGDVTGDTGLEDFDSADLDTAITDDSGIGENVFAARKVDDLVAEINETFAGQVRASNDNGRLRIENLSTQDLKVGGASAGALTGADASATIEGNSVRAGLSKQFNELRDQLDKLADDASFNGINLLRGDKLTITFNETGTSSIDIQTENGETVNAFNLGVPTNLEERQLDSDVTIDTLLADMKTALDEVRSQASTFGSNLSIVQNRKAFTEAMINTLETGAGNLTLADMNTEAANLLALQTRQQLSQNSLSLASQADQSILQLLR